MLSVGKGTDLRGLAAQTWQTANADRAL